MTFQDKIVWITGASSGIGEALCYEFARHGAELILSARRMDELERVGRRCKELGATSHVIPIDLNAPESVKSAAQTALEECPAIDILVHGAGVTQRSLAVETPLEVDRRLLEVNFFGPVLLSKEVLPSMVRRKAGHIVVISSVTGKFGFPLRSAYAAAKHALHGFFESLRAELVHDNIWVTLVCPGRVNTPISVHALNRAGNEHGLMDQGQQHGISAQACARKILAAVERRKKEVLIGRGEVVLAWLRRFLPGLFYYLVSRLKPM